MAARAAQRPRRDRTLTERPPFVRRIDPGPALACTAAPLPPNGKFDWHAFCAAWNCGELGLSPPAPPALSVTLVPPPENFGSGKLGTPWWRMHSENFSAASCILACCAGLGAIFEGAYLLHAFSAAWNWDDSGFGPWPLWFSMCMPPSLGSGNSGSPWVRMHCANSTIFFWTAALVSPDSGVPPLDPPEALDGLELLVVPMWATPALGLEEPPQAARRRLADTTHRTLARTSGGRRDTGAPLRVDR